MQAVFRDMVDKAGLTEQFYIDSYAISPYSVGKGVSHGMQKELLKRGIEFTHEAQFFEYHLFDLFDLILVATEDIKEHLLDKAPKNCLDKIHLLTEYSEKHNGVSIPDPFHSGGHDQVFLMIEDSCRALLNTFC